MRHRATAAAVLLAACSSTSAPPAPQQAVFTAGDYSFTGPDTIAPGMTQLRMVNEGAEAHHLILAELPDGRSVQDLVDHWTATPHSDPEWLVTVGGAGAVQAGDSAGSTVDLPEGRYAAICLLPGPDGAAHVLKGMIRELVVSGTAVEAAPPTASATLRMSDFTYSLPAMTAGTHTLLMVNDGVQIHEAQLVKLDGDATAAEYIAAFTPGASGPPPGRLAGGSGPLSPGREAYWTFTLEPGRYAIACVVPDPATGRPHFALGMVTEFEVAAAE